MPAVCSSRSGRNVNKTNEGAVLDYVLQEKPKLAQIRFAGDTNSTSATLGKSLASKVGERLDERVLFNDAQTLQKLYQESGFPGNAGQIRDARERRSRRGRSDFRNYSLICRYGG